MAKKPNKQAAARLAAALLASDAAEQPKRKVPRRGMSRSAYLQLSLRQFEELAISAEADESWGAAVDAKQKAIALRAQLDEMAETARRARIPASPEAHKAEILHEVRRLRQAAGASYVAANLLRLEREMLDSDDTARRERERDASGRQSDEELEAEAERLRAERAPALRVVE